MIKIFKGSIFDTNCDLIVIPCGSDGEVSSQIAEELMVNGYSYYKRNITPGDIIFYDNVGNYSSASVVGFASSVKVSDEQLCRSFKIANSESNEKIILSILKKIKEFCLKESYTIVNIPLLGTGAGGLNAKLSYNLIKEQFENETIIINICIISSIVYKEISSEINNKTIVSKNIPVPRVFISYTGIDTKNAEWVKKLAIKLRQNGVDARIDFFFLKVGQDLPQWMTREITLADKVLLICDQYYVYKADFRKGGVGWETMIIQGDMLMNQEKEKYIAIVRDKNIDQSLPIYMKSKYAFNWFDDSNDDENLKRLLLILFNCNYEDCGPVLPPPNYIIESLNTKHHENTGISDGSL